MRISSAMTAASDGVSIASAMAVVGSVSPFGHPSYELGIVVLSIQRIQLRVAAN